MQGTTCVSITNNLPLFSQEPELIRKLQRALAVILDDNEWTGNHLSKAKDFSVLKMRYRDRFFNTGFTMGKLSEGHS
jgi:hypothetical protein